MVTTHNVSLFLRNTQGRHFPGGPGVKNPAAHTGDMG